MKCAFICWRPYQIFNAINLLYNNVEDTKGNSDIYIQDIPAMTKLIPEISKLGCFNHIYTYTEKNRGDGVGITPLKMAGIYAMRTVSFIAPKRAIKKNCPQIQAFAGEYDVILCSGWISFSMEFANCNPNAKFILFEDGAGNYVSNIIENLPLKEKAYYSILKGFFKKGPLVIKVTGMYVYEPSAMAVSRKYPVYAMPKITEEIYDILAKVFKYDQDDGTYRDDSIVFLDQPYKKYGDNYDQDQVISFLAKSPQFVCRRHPIQKVNERNLYEDKKRPMWELAAKRFNSNTVLVSIFSTTQLTPALIYGVYPTLVFLYKINDEKGSDTYMRKKNFIDLFRLQYQGIIYEPETFQEFVANMNSIRESARQN